MLIVDDSVVIRRLISHALTEDPHIEVVGTAADGSIALQRIPQYQPDVITLDVEMPVMDGLETLRQLRARYPAIHVIMFSTLTERGAEATVTALSLGAADYVPKAANAGSLDRSMESLRSELVPKIKQFYQLPSPTPQVSSNSSTGALSSAAPVKLGSRQAVRAPKVVAIGVSTGGPNALAEVLPMFAADFPLPILIVQHMPPVFTRLLAERLSCLTALAVEEAKDEALVKPQKILIAPGDYHMKLRRNRAGQTVVALNQEPQENSCRPSVDVLFRSVAEVYDGAAIAVMLTGMGSDGVRGITQLRQQGAYVIAQDEATATVWGMPGAVIKAGLADSVVPLSSVVPEILKQLKAN